jgi:hypothetical protein
MASAWHGLTIIFNHATECRERGIVLYADNEEHAILRAIEYFAGIECEVVYTGIIEPRL